MQKSESNDITAPNQTTQKETEFNLARSFQKFFNVSSLFSRNSNNSTMLKNESALKLKVEQDMLARKQILSTQASQLLNSHALLPFAKMVTKGYQPDEAQLQQFNQDFRILVENREATKIATLLQTGMKLTHDNYIALMCNNQIQLFAIRFPDSKADLSSSDVEALSISRDGVNSLEQVLKPVPDYNGTITTAEQHRINKIAYSYIGQQMAAYNQDKEYNHALFVHVIQHLAALTVFFDREKESAKKPGVFDIEGRNIVSFCAVNNNLSLSGNLDKMFDHMLTCVPLNEYSQLIVQIDKIKDWKMNTEQGWAYDVKQRLIDANERWEKLVQVFHKNLNDSFEQRFASDIDNILNETQTLYMDQYLTQKASEQSIQNSQHYSIEMLPDDTRHLVQSICTQYDVLNQNFGRLDETDKHNLRGLVQEKMPKYINDFLSMNEEYRTTMVNAQGKNAQTLLNESMSNILENLKNIEMRLNEDNLKELSVGAKYTKAKMM